MKRLAMVSAALAACVAMPALAQGGPPPDPYGDATVSKADAEKRAGERFDQLDADHNGTLTPEERRAGFGGGGGGFGGGAPGGGGGGPGGMMGPQDKAAYIAAQLQRFDMQDGDRNGQLTKAERDAFRQQMMQRFQQGGQ